MSKVLYIAGPMSKIPQFNFPLFEAVAVALRDDGLTIVSPHECDSDETRKQAWASPDGMPGQADAETWGECLARDVKMLADGLPPDDYDAAGNEVTGGKTLVIDGIALLPNWEKSRGARLEAFVGLLTGKEFYTVDEYTTDDSGQWRDVGYRLSDVTAEWVQHALALDWADGIRMHKPLQYVDTIP